MNETHETENIIVKSEYHIGFYDIVGYALITFGLGISIGILIGITTSNDKAAKLVEVQAVEKGHGVWGLDAKGEQVFVWKERGDK